jgi:hypothetical protein
MSGLITYTMHIEEGVKGCVLDAIALRATHGIGKIRFLTIHQAAVSAQRHANGDAEAILRIHQHGTYPSRPIPLPESWVPDDDADFYAAFVAPPARLFRMVI